MVNLTVRRMSELSNEPKHGDMITEAYVELFKINKPELPTSSMSSMQYKGDAQSLLPFMGEAKTCRQ